MMNKKGIILAFLCIAVFLPAGCTQTDDVSEPTLDGTPSMDISSSTDTQFEATAEPASQSETDVQTPVPTPVDEGEGETETTGEPMDSPEPAGEVFTSADGALKIDIPESWAAKYTVEQSDGRVTFYDIANQDAGYGGALFTIMTYAEDESYDYLPDYLVLGEHNGLTYVALFPTDVQCDTSDAELMAIHAALADGLYGWLGSAVYFVG